MKIAIRYQSKGGNTRAVAEAIADEVGVNAEPIATPISEPVDILFIGGAIYAFGMDSSLKNYLQSLDPAMIKSVASFSTGMKMSIANKICTAAKKKGISVCDDMLSITGMKSNVLTDIHMKQIGDFVKMTLPLAL